VTDLASLAATRSQPGTDADRRSRSPEAMMPVAQRVARLVALALPEEVELARPMGVGRAPATYEIPIEGRDEWLAAAGLSA
jgi:hypothetical protein